MISLELVFLFFVAGVFSFSSGSKVGGEHSLLEGLG